MDIDAEKIGMDPLEFRLKNTVDEGEIDVRGQRVHIIGAKECLEKVATWIELDKPDIDALIELVQLRPRRGTGLYGLAKRRTEKMQENPLPARREFMTSELSLRGQLHELPQRFFLRRDHPHTSVRAYPRTRSRAAWFDPKNEGKFVPIHWRWFREYLSAIRRTPMSTSERLACRLLMVSWAARHGTSLAKEAGQVAEYRGGKEKVFGFFVGLAMKASRGKANPAQLNEILKKKLAG